MITGGLQSLLFLFTMSIQLIRILMKLLTYNPIAQQSKVEANTSPTGFRLYTKDGVSLPSVTSVISYTMDDYKRQMIESYKQKHQDCEELWAKCRKFGDRFHLEMELIMKGQVGYDNSHPFADEMNTWAEVSLSEQTMWSIRTGLAGTCDGLVRLPNGDYRLIDFKTTMKNKTRSYCSDYAIQLGMYKMMIEDLYDVKITDSKILMLHYNISDGSTIKPLVFSWDYKQLQVVEEKARLRVKQYNDLFMF